MKNYKIDFTNKKIVLSKAFADMAQNINSDEYELLSTVSEQFPTFQIVKRTHQSPKKANANKGLTYENMERYISVFENSYELFDLYHKVKELSYAQSNPYMFVRDWFLEQFPNYNEMPSFENGKLYAEPLDKLEVFYVSKRDEKEAA